MVSGTLIWIFPPLRRKDSCFKAKSLTGFRMMLQDQRKKRGKIEQERKRESEREGVERCSPSGDEHPDLECCFRSKSHAGEIVPSGNPSLVHRSLAIQVIGEQQVRARTCA